MVYLTYKNEKCNFFKYKNINIHAKGINCYWSKFASKY